MAAGVVVASAGMAAAQPEVEPDETFATPPSTPPETTPQDQGKESKYGFGAIDYTLHMYSSYEDSAGLKSSDGEVSIGRVGAEFDATMPASETVRLRLRAAAEYANFDFDGVSKLSLQGRTPVEELSSYKFGLGIEQQIDEHWSWLGRGMLRDGIEGGANVADGLAGDLTAGMMYQVRPGVRIGLGGTVFWRVEDYTRFLPVPFVDLDLALTEHWRIVLTIPEWGGFVYKPSRDFSMNIGVGVRWQDYRLSSNNQVPNGVFREVSFPAMVEVNWRFAEAWTLEAGVGSNLYQRLDLNDQDGNSVADSRTDFAPLFLLGVKWNF